MTELLTGSSDDVSQNFEFSLSSDEHVEPTLVVGVSISIAGSLQQEAQDFLVAVFSDVVLAVILDILDFEGGTSETN